MKKALYILLIFLIFSSAKAGELFNDTLPIAGKVYYNWYFGSNAGITFNTSDKEPIFLPNNLFSGDTLQNASTISDKDGNFILHTNGELIFSKTYELIYEDMGGNHSQNEGSVLAPLTNDRFIFFSTLYANNITNANQFDPPRNLNDTTGLIYSVFSYDKDADTLIFEVYKKQLNESYRSEAIQLTYSSITNNYILIGYDTKGEISAYEFDINGNFLRLNKQPYFKSLNKTHQLEIRVNQMCDRIAINSGRESRGGYKTPDSLKYSYIFLCNFDPNELRFYKQLKIKISELYMKTIEFSPNSNYIYTLLNNVWLAANWRESLVRYDIRNDKVENVHESNMSRRGFNEVRDLRVGPNDKLYLFRGTANYLSCIENPNDSLNPIYKEKKVKFKSFEVDSLDYESVSPYCVIDSPQFIAASFAEVFVKSNITLCEGELLELYSKSQFHNSQTIYNWQGPNGFKSKEQFPVIEDIKLYEEGLYRVIVTNGKQIDTAETYVTVNPFPKLKLLVYPDYFICDGKITISTEEKYHSYLWSTGDTSEYIEVDESGIYSLTVENKNGCTGYKEVKVKIASNYFLSITGDTIKCKGESVTLTSEEEYPSYRWSNGADTRSIIVTEPMKYTLTVTTEDGCEIKRTIEVKDHPNVIAELKPAPTTICEGDSVLLESKYDAPYFDYLWNTNDSTKNIYVSKTGTYKLTISDTRTGCMDSTEITISVEDNLQPTIIGSDICEGETATLEALPNDPSYSYEWSNGETTPTIAVSQPATYTVTVSKDGCSGTAEFTVNESPNPEFEILGEDIVCWNSATLTPDKDFSEYLWSTDEITKEIEVTEPGTYTLTVTDENGCSATEEYTVNEQSLSFDISKDRIDFGKVYISETALDSVTIINRSGIELTITDGTQNYIIPDGFPVRYTKTLKPTELGPYNDSFEYRVIEPCDTVITIPVTAEVYAKVEISTKEETETKIGAKVSIPVYLQAEADLSEQTYTITTDIDQKALYTEDDFSFTQTTTINKVKTKVHEISGMIMLASELEYDITFPSYEFNNPYIEVIDRPGKILIDSICAFPLRSVTFTESTEMKVSPNPARDRLVIVVTTGHFDKLNDQSNKSVAEPVEASGQQMQLELISAEGRIAYTQNWTQTSSEKQISINTDKIPSGLYQVRLQTPDGVLTENVIVVR